MFLKIGSNQIPYTAGCNLAFLRQKEQEFVNEILDEQDNVIKITVYNSERLKEESKNSDRTLPKEKIKNILKDENKTKEDGITLKLPSDVGTYFKDESPEAIRDKIVRTEQFRVKISDLISEYSKFENPEQSRMENLINAIRNEFENKNIQTET